MIQSLHTINHRHVCKCLLLTAACLNLYTISLFMWCYWFVC